MTAIKGTNVAAPIVPFDSADTYGTHDSTYGIGGWREVATTTIRDAIPSPRLRAGMLVYCADTNLTYKLDADLTTWRVFRRYDAGVYFPGKPTGNQYIARIVFPTALTILATLPFSQFAVRVNPTANTTFTLNKFHSGSATSIGSILFNTSGVASVTFASDVTFAAGDLLEVQAPAAPDGTAADFSFTFVCKLN